MTTKTDFLTQGTLSFSCGLDNRDPVKGYAKEKPVEQTPHYSLLKENKKLSPVIQNTSERE